MAEDAEPFAEWQQEQMMVTSRPSWMFGLQEATKVLELHFQLKGLDGLGFDTTDGPAIRAAGGLLGYCLLYTSPSPRDGTKSRMPSSA